MPEKSLEEINMDLARTFRDPDWVASRIGSKPFTPRTEEQFRLDMADLRGRKIGNVLRVVIWLILLPLQLAWLVLSNFPAILQAALWIMTFGMIAAVIGFFLWL